MRDANFVMVSSHRIAAKATPGGDATRLREAIDLAPRTQVVVNLFISAGMIVCFDQTSGTISFRRAYEFLQAGANPDRHAQLLWLCHERAIRAPGGGGGRRQPRSFRYVGNQRRDELRPRVMKGEELRRVTGGLYRRLYKSRASDPGDRNVGTFHDIRYGRRRRWIRWPRCPPRQAILAAGRAAKTVLLGDFRHAIRRIEDCAPGLTILGMYKHSARFTPSPHSRRGIRCGTDGSPGSGREREGNAKPEQR